MGDNTDMSASSDLLWALTKKNNAFLGKRNGLQLSSEPGNIMNKNSFKYSGLANLESVDVQDNTKGISFSRKNKATGSKPKRNLVTVDLKKGFRQVHRRLSQRPRVRTTVRIFPSLPSHAGTRSGSARTRSEELGTYATLEWAVPHNELPR